MGLFPTDEVSPGAKYESILGPRRRARARFTRRPCGRNLHRYGRKKSKLIGRGSSLSTVLVEFQPLPHLLARRGPDDSAGSSTMGQRARRLHYWSTTRMPGLTTRCDRSRSRPTSSTARPRASLGSSDSANPNNLKVDDASCGGAATRSSFRARLYRPHASVCDLCRRRVDGAKVVELPRGPLSASHTQWPDSSKTSCQPLIARRNATSPPSTWVRRCLTRSSRPSSLDTPSVPRSVRRYRWRMRRRREAAPCSFARGLMQSSGITVEDGHTRYQDT